MVQPVPPGEEGLDALLGAYFRAEMPSPWPAFAPPRPQTLPFRPAATPRKRRGFLVFSRLALAASVAVLLLAAWLMPRGPLSSGNAPGLLKGAPTASPHTGGHELTPQRQQDLLPPLPDLKDVLPPAEGDKAPDKVKSSLQLEQKDGKTGIKITVEELPPNK